VCYEDTGHVEVVRIIFDPAKISYDKLVEYFFRLHDPTQVNRQGPDYGEQYRTVIFTYSDEQIAAAERVRTRAASSGRWKRPIATTIEPASEFYRAEEYHQRYFEKNGGESCHIAPPLDEPL
jgi:peptide-methionine (S)-S-oxide reductase